MGKTKKISNKARMTMVEKYKTQQMLAAGKDVKEIATALERTEETISKYIDTELKNLVTAISPSEPVKKERPKIDEEVFSSTVAILKKNGIEQVDAISAINKIEAKITEPIDNPEKLATLCLRELTVHKSIIREAVGGQKGVTIMTKAASEIIESKKTNTRAENRRNSFYRPQKNG